MGVGVRPDRGRPWLCIPQGRLLSPAGQWHLGSWQGAGEEPPGGAGAAKRQNFHRTPAGALVTERLQDPVGGSSPGQHLSPACASPDCACSESAPRVGCAFSPPSKCMLVCPREILRWGAVTPEELSSSWPFSCAKPTRVLAAVQPLACLPLGWERLADGGHTAQPARGRARCRGGSSRCGSEGLGMRAARGRTHAGKPSSAWVFGGLKLRFHEGDPHQAHQRMWGSGGGVCKGACMWTL